MWDDENRKTVVCTMPERINADASGLHAELMEIFGGDAVETRRRSHAISSRCAPWGELAAGCLHSSTLL